MKTCTIEKDRWKSFFDEFSRLHRGQRVMVESQMKDYGVQSNVRNLPLQGAVVESKGERGMEIELSSPLLPD